jgi:hypothetical protein
MVDIYLLKLSMRYSNCSGSSERSVWPIVGSPLSYVEIADEDGTLVTRVEIPSPKR